MAKNPTVPWLIAPSLFLFLTHGIQCFFLPNATHLESILNQYQDGQPHSRAKRSISRNDQDEILMLHNKLRGEVYPSASNMEYMDCGGPKNVFFLAFVTSPVLLYSQTLFRHRSPGFHVQSWYDEVKDYTYPYAHECSPWCPDRCAGPMCTHYTQMVWATTNKIGCAINVCKRMDVWGEVWENAVYLVCNYSPKGNWIGEAPYKNGRSCSQCPPSYGGGCRANLCYKEKVVEKPETDRANEVEIQKVPDRIQPKSVKPAKEKKPAEVTYMTQVIKCDTKMRDTCRGSTCNRYLCPAGCLNSKAKVFGFPNYESASSICRAAIHSGVLDNRGGLVDITRKGRSDFFVMSLRNGIRTLSKHKPSNSFAVLKVTVQTLDCYTTVEELCPFKKPTTHCPSVHEGIVVVSQEEYLKIMTNKERREEKGSKETKKALERKWRAKPHLLENLLRLDKAVSQGS
ncbi:hypothetical protein Chor_001264 [Crotalus horridus]